MDAVDVLIFQKKLCNKSIINYKCVIAKNAMDRKGNNSPQTFTDQYIILLQN